MRIGEKIRFIRQQSGMSQEKLSELLYISRQSVSAWEREERLPSLENIVQLSEIFGVSTDYLLKSGNKSLRKRQRIIFSEKSFHI
ncbi:MAG: helix-turn-helix domain-containing protein [Firmicutes bacterium]|nr:helix-turn-helix domain-containing protein [Bacillota bacterium]